jgi:hypothetical protein
MVIVKVDNALAEQLTGAAAIVNEAGRCIGFFSLPDMFRDLVDKSMAYECEHETREEALADCAKNGVYTSEEADEIIRKALAARMTYTF